MTEDGPEAHCYLTLKNVGEMREALACLLLLTATLMTNILRGSVQASKKYYQMKQEGTTWEAYRAEANACGAGGGGRHGDASI